MFLALHGITKSQLQIPEIQEDLSKAVERHVFNKLEADRYAEEIKLWNSDNRGKEIRKKINDYLNIDDRNRQFVSDLDDLDAGRDIDRANETATVVEPESMDSNTPAEEPTPKKDDESPTQGPSTPPAP